MNCRRCGHMQIEHNANGVCLFRITLDSGKMTLCPCNRFEGTE